MVYYLLDASTSSHFAPHHTALHACMHDISLMPCHVSQGGPPLPNGAAWEGEEGELRGQAVLVDQLAWLQTAGQCVGSVLEFMGATAGAVGVSPIKATASMRAVGAWAEGRDTVLRAGKDQQPGWKGH